MPFEKRNLRPFDALDKTQSKLTQLLRIQSPPIPAGFQPPLGGIGTSPLGVANGHIAAANGTLLMDRDEYLSAGIGLYFGTNEDEWLDLTKTASQELETLFGRVADAPVSIVVSVTNTRLKQVHQLASIPFNDWVNSSWRHPLVKAGATANRPRPLRMPQDGCAFQVQFLLSEDLPKTLRVSGRPWRKGSWLARISIRVVSSHGGGLAPRPLTDQVRERFRLGSNTSSFVDLRGDRSGICMVSDLSEVLTVYIDEKLLKDASEINDRGEHLRIGAAPLINFWVMEIYRGLIYLFSSDPELDGFDPTVEQHRQSFLFSLLSQIEDAGLATVEEALLLLQDQPFRVSALAEHLLGLRLSEQSLLELSR